MTDQMCNRPVRISASLRQTCSFCNMIWLIDTPCSSQ
jgi:hypothetical protein